MIVCQPTLHQGANRRATGAAVYATLMEDFYRELLDQPLPPRLTSLAWQLRQAEGECSTKPSRR